MLLAELAHNVIIWARNDLAGVDRRLKKYGIQRTVRDVLQVAGSVEISAEGRIEQITLNERHPLAVACQKALTSDDLSLILGKIQVLKITGPVFMLDYYN